MDEHRAAYAAIAAYGRGASNCGSGEMVSVPVDDLVRFYRAYLCDCEYTDDGVYKCVCCREELMTAPGMMCSRCERNRLPKPEGFDPWEMVL